MIAEMFGIPLGKLLEKSSAYGSKNVFRTTGAFFVLTAEGKFEWFDLSGRSIVNPMIVQIFYPFYLNHEMRLTRVSVPCGVSCLWERAFGNVAKTVEEIELPKSLSTIRSYAFAWCEKLKTIRLPSRTEYVAEDAFLGCTSLEIVEAPVQLKSDFRKIQNLTPGFRVRYF